MIALLSLLLVLSVSLAIMRVETAALVRTGVSEESARFQALSAFLGVGFTRASRNTCCGIPCAGAS